MSAEPFQERSSRERGIRATREGGLAEIVIARPARRNAMSAGMWEALAETARTLDPGVRAVIVSGEGTKAFSAGADISEFADVYRDRAAAAATRASCRRDSAR